MEDHSCQLCCPSQQGGEFLAALEYKDDKNVKFIAASHVRNALSGKNLHCMTEQKKDFNQREVLVLHEVSHLFFIRYDIFVNCNWDDTWWQ
jgi:hypothetical protein